MPTTVAEKAVARPRASGDVGDPAGAEPAFSDALLQSELDSAPDAVMVIESTGERISFNRRFADMWGLPTRFTEGSPAMLRRILDQVAEPAAFQSEVDRFRADPASPVRCTLELVDGRVVDCSSGSLRIDGGSAVGRVWYFRDVTDRKQREAALRVANRLLTDQVEASPDGVLVVGSDRNIVFYNQRFLELWRVPAEVALTRSDERALASVMNQLKDPAAFLTILGQLYADANMRVHDEIELADGRVFERYSDPLPLAPDRPPGRIFFFRDITASKRASIALAQERDMYTALVESLPGLFLLVDAGGKLVAWNENLTSLLGKSHGELAGAALLDFVASAERGAVGEKLALAMSGSPVVSDVPVVTASGEARTVLATCRRLDRDGGPFVLAVAVDVTDARCAEARLNDSEARFHAIFDSVSDGIILHDPGTGQFIDANSRVCEMFGYARAEFLSMDVARLSVNRSPAAVEGSMALMARAAAGERQTFEWHAIGKEGAPFWIEVSLRRVTFGSRDYLLSTAHDITERKHAADELAYRDRVLDAVTSGTTALLGAPSLREGIARAFAAVGPALGVDRVVLVELPEGPASPPALRHVWESPEMEPTEPGALATALSAGDAAAWLVPLAQGRPVVATLRSSSGDVRSLLEQLRILSMVVMPIHLGPTLWGSLGFDSCLRERDWTAVDVDLLRIVADVIGSAVLRDRARVSLEASEERFRALAREDALTGLANRRVFVESVDQAIARTQRGSPAFAILYLDLDHFKDINDTLGHPAGDTLLKVVADRLRTNVRAVDLVARFGGDEFAIIAPGVTEPATVAVLAERVQAALRAPLCVVGSEIRTAVSIGMAIYGQDAGDAETLLSHADMALYRAKADGRGTSRFFTDAMDAEVRTRVRLASELRRAIDGDELFLLYQPQVDVATGLVVGVEALVRWRHPTRGTVSPAEFIPAAEKLGLIAPLGRWVLREACAQMRRWLDAGAAPATVAVNVSALQFRSPLELEKDVLDSLKEFDISPTLLELELTETVLMEAWAKHEDLVSRLRAEGVRIAIDDFGTGFSSLEYLTRFPVDRIKIAQTFVADLERKAESAAIVKATLGLARELRLGVVAEGVENEVQLGLLTGWGCAIVQGYYFARPLTPEGVVTALKDGLAHTA